MAIDETETACEVEIARGAHDLYDMGLKQADAVIDEVKAEVASWRDEAGLLQISRSEQDAMAFAFGE